MLLCVLRGFVGTLNFTAKTQRPQRISNDVNLALCASWLCGNPKISRKDTKTSKNF